MQLKFSTTDGETSVHECAMHAFSFHIFCIFFVLYELCLTCINSALSDIAIGLLEMRSISFRERSRHGEQLTVEAFVMCGCTCNVYADSWSQVKTGGFLKGQTYFVS